MHLVRYRKSWDPTSRYSFQITSHRADRLTLLELCHALWLDKCDLGPVTTVRYRILPDDPWIFFPDDSIGINLTPWSGMVLDILLEGTSEHSVTQQSVMGGDLQRFTNSMPQNHIPIPDVSYNSIEDSYVNYMRSFLTHSDLAGLVLCCEDHREWRETSSVQISAERIGQTARLSQRFADMRFPIGTADDFSVEFVFPPLRRGLDSHFMRNGGRYVGYAVWIKAKVPQTQTQTFANAAVESRSIGDGLIDVRYRLSSVDGATDLYRHIQRLFHETLHYSLVASHNDYCMWEENSPTDASSHKAWLALGLSSETVWLFSVSQPYYYSNQAFVRQSIALLAAVIKARGQLDEQHLAVCTG
jgi:hypothetical protein